MTERMINEVDQHGMFLRTRPMTEAEKVTWPESTQMMWNSDMPSLNGAATFLSKDGSTAFVRLPRELWRSAGICHCPHCKGGEGFWDTLAVSTKLVDGRNTTAWTVHYPVFGK